MRKSLVLRPTMRIRSKLSLIQMQIVHGTVVPSRSRRGSVAFNRDEFHIFQQIAPKARLHSFLRPREKCTVNAPVSARDAAQ
jgi:hypothetical protein